MNDRSISTSNVSPQAARPMTHLQTYFSPAAPPNFNPHFADSPYSSGSSSSFPNDSPPAEPPAEMESDYTPIISSPDDPRYSYYPFEQSDPSEWATRDLSAMPYNAEGFSQQPLSTLPTTPLSWPPSDTKKFQTQQFQHPQQQQQHPQQQHQQQPTQRVNYPSFSGQAGRLRSMSDGTPPGSGNNANSMSSLYAQPLYSGQNAEELELVYPQDADSRLMDNGANAHSHSPFSHIHSYPRDQQQDQRSQQPARIRREMGRSMSDAAVRPPTYASSSQPGAYGSFGLTMHPTNTTTFHSSDQDSQSHAGYAPQHQGGTQHSIPAPIPIPVPIYGSLPTYNFHEHASNLNTAYSPGGLPDQNIRIKEEFSPTTRFRQMDIRGGQSGCNPQYVNGDMNAGMRGGAGHNGSTQEVFVVKEEDREKEEFVTRHSGDRANGGVHSELLHTESDKDADGDDDRDGDYQTGEDEDFDFDVDGDSEYVTRSRRASVSTFTQSLRPRRRSSSATRYQPYVFPNNGSTSPTATKSTDAPSSSEPTTRPKTRVRSRQTASLPVPIPVPNLTKKSRGRRVPTVDSLITTTGRSASGNPQNDGEDGDGKNARTYTCDAAGCGKCFARGEHLKRHVRSIHTYEKR